MGRKLAFDKILFASTLIPVFIGLVMIYSASAVIALEHHHSPYHYLIKQAVAAFIGIILMIYIMHIDYRKLEKRLVVYVFLLFSFALLMGLILARGTPLVPGIAGRWFVICGVSFQPSELAKIGLILFLAFYLSRPKKDPNQILRTLLPALFVVGTAAILVVMQPDFGTAVTLVMIALILFFCAGLKLSYLFASVLFCLPIGGGLIFSPPYRIRRIRAYLDPWKFRYDEGFQAVQSRIAIGSGGIIGLGLVEGKQKLFFLPEPHTDFIYSVIAEEMGLVGCLVVLALFSVFLWRGLRASLKAPNRFGIYLGLGITFIIVIQALINISVAVTLFPTKGIPLPFISAGGTSLMISLAAVGILLNISQHSN